MPTPEGALVVSIPMPPDSVLNPSKPFAYSQIQKVTLNAGIDWSKLWPEVASQDKAMPYDGPWYVQLAWGALYCGHRWEQGGLNCAR
jgi:hypothetical protein